MGTRNEPNHKCNSIRCWSYTIGCVEGTWVVGFFIDGPDAQQPMIIGTLPGVPKTDACKRRSKWFSRLYKCKLTT